MTNEIELALNKLPDTEIEPDFIKASIGSYESWTHWAEQYLDSKDVDNKRLSQAFSSCSGGDGKPVWVQATTQQFVGTKKWRVNSMRLGAI